MEGTVTTMTVSSALEQVWTLAGDALDFITGNAIMFTIFCVSLIPAGFMVIRKAKHSAY